MESNNLHKAFPSLHRSLLRVIMIAFAVIYKYLNKSLIRPKTSFFNRLQPTELPTSGLAEESVVTRILFPGRTEGLRGSAKVVIRGHSPAQEELNPMVKVQRIVLPF